MFSINKVNDSPGLNSDKEIIEILLSVMTEPNCPVIILADYEEDMYQLVKMYPGLKRRFKNEIF